MKNDQVYPNRRGEVQQTLDKLNADEVLDGNQDVGGDSKYDEYVNEIGMNSNIHELVDKAFGVW